MSKYQSQAICSLWTIDKFIVFLKRFERVVFSSKGAAKSMVSVRVTHIVSINRKFVSQCIYCWPGEICITPAILIYRDRQYHFYSMAGWDLFYYSVGIMRAKAQCSLVVRCMYFSSPCFLIIHQTQITIETFTKELNKAELFSLWY